MSLSEIVNVTITAETTSPTRAGFGVPLIAGYHTAWLNRVREYTDLTGLVDDGIAATHPIYRCAAKILAQNPRVTKFKVGRRGLVHTQKWRLIPTNTTEGLVYTLDFVKPDGTAAQATYTVAPADTVALIIDGLVAAINALASFAMTAVDNTTNMDLTVDTPGELFDVVVNKELTIKDTTTDPGIATDLAAILTEDPTDWYGLVLDSNSEAEGLAAAAWAESNGKLLAVNSYDSEILDSIVTSDFFSDAQAAGYARTFGIWAKGILSYAGAAWMGKLFPFDPGTETWAFKTLASVVVSSNADLTSGQRTTILSKGGNYYHAVAGVSITRFGKTFADEFIDITRYIDFLQARLQENIFGLLVNALKIPYTDGGVDLIKSEILAQLNRGIAAGAIAATPAPTVTAPLVADVAAVDRAARLLPDVKFTAQLAGAIHTITITGTLTV